MPSHKKVRTYYNKRKDLDPLPPSTILRRRRRRGARPKLPVAPVLKSSSTDSSVQNSNPFDKLLQGEIYNPVKVSSRYGKNFTSDSSNTKSAISVNFHLHSPILTRSREKKKDISEELSSFKVPASRSSPLIKSSSVECLKKPNTDRSHLKVPTEGADNIKGKMFTDSFREKVFVHSSTPSVNNNFRQIVNAEISPIVATGGTPRKSKDRSRGRQLTDVKLLWQPRVILEKLDISQEEIKCHVIPCNDVESNDVNQNDNNDVIEPQYVTRRGARRNAKPRNDADEIIDDVISQHVNDAELKNFKRQHVTRRKKSRNDVSENDVDVIKSHTDDVIERQNVNRMGLGRSAKQSDANKIDDVIETGIDDVIEPQNVKRRGRVRRNAKLGSDGNKIDDVLETDIGDVIGPQSLKRRRRPRRNAKSRNVENETSTDVSKIDDVVETDIGDVMEPQNVNRIGLGPSAKLRSDGNETSTDVNKIDDVIETCVDDVIGPRSVKRRGRARRNAKSRNIESETSIDVSKIDDVVETDIDDVIEAQNVNRIDLGRSAKVRSDGNETSTDLNKIDDVIETCVDDVIETCVDDVIGAQSVKRRGRPIRRNAKSRNIENETSTDVSKIDDVVETDIDDVIEPQNVNRINLGRSAKLRSNENETFTDVNNVDDVIETCVDDVIGPRSVKRRGRPRRHAKSRNVENETLSDVNKIDDVVETNIDDVIEPQNINRIGPGPSAKLRSNEYETSTGVNKIDDVIETGIDEVLETGIDDVTEPQNVKRRGRLRRNAKSRNEENEAFGDVNKIDDVLETDINHVIEPQNVNRIGPGRSAKHRSNAIEASDDANEIDDVVETGIDDVIVPQNVKQRGRPRRNAKIGSDSNETFSDVNKIVDVVETDIDDVIEPQNVKRRGRPRRNAKLGSDANEASSDVNKIDDVMSQHVDDEHQIVKRKHSKRGKKSRNDVSENDNEMGDVTSQDGTEHVEVKKSKRKRGRPTSLSNYGNDSCDVEESVDVIESSCVDDDVETNAKRKRGRANAKSGKDVKETKRRPKEEKEANVKQRTDVTSDIEDFFGFTSDETKSSLELSETMKQTINEEKSHTKDVTDDARGFSNDELDHISNISETVKDVFKNEEQRLTLRDVTESDVSESKSDVNRLSFKIPKRRKSRKRRNFARKALKTVESKEESSESVIDISDDDAECHSDVTPISTPNRSSKIVILSDVRLSLTAEAINNTLRMIRHDHSYTPTKTPIKRPESLDLDEHSYHLNSQRNLFDISENDVTNEKKPERSILLKHGKSYRRSLGLFRKTTDLFQGHTSDARNVQNLRTSVMLPVGRGARKSILHQFAQSHLENDAEDTQDTAKQLVLRRCEQGAISSFAECYPESALQNCQKIGEGVYGEVFLYRKSDGSTSVIKIIPIEGDLIVNGEKQKKFAEILSEIVVTQELSNLRHNAKNATEGFVEVKSVRCVKGKYPDRLLDLWDLYAETKFSENDSPQCFPSEQLYIVLELANGGKDLESYVFKNSLQAFSIFQQVACALAVAENQLKFEHRDLHWGNVLISSVDLNKTLRFRLNGKEIEIKSQGVQATIIDFTLSRMEYEGVAIFNDLSQDEELFLAHGDLQFDIYRMMKDSNSNNWLCFTPYTNVLWLHYILDKAVSGLRYTNVKSKLHKEYIKKLKIFKESVLTFDSVAQFVQKHF